MTVFIDIVRALDHEWFLFVTRGPAAAHAVVFGALGAVLGWLVALWVRPLVAAEGTTLPPHQARRLPALLAAINAALLAGMVLAVIQGNCQSLVEGGSIDWVQWRLLYHAALVAALLAATALDLACYVIPDAVTFPAAVAGLLWALALGNMHLIPVWIDWNQEDPIRGPYIPQWIGAHPHWHGLAHSLSGLAAGAGITWSARGVARAMLRVEALGFGDVTLMAMIGAFLGWQPVVVVFLLAPLCGILAALLMKAARGRRAMPYGPCLALAALVVLFTWRWLWIPTREIFGHWPTLLGLAALVIGGMALLLGLLRLYRSIPVAMRRQP